jgi:D-sedoheptulose 7-phosphate isomerase
MAFIDDYFNETIRAYNTVDKSEIEKVCSILIDAKENKKNVFIIGNGGSAALSIHFAQDLFKMCGIKARSLAENISNVTALSNDISYIDVFVEQLKIYAQEGDVLIALTGSGNSPNIVKACASIDNLTVIGFVGYDGGKVSQYLDAKVHAWSDIMTVCETVHTLVAHYIIEFIKYFYINIKKQNEEL